MRWTKILANTGLVFFTTMAGILTVDALINWQLQLWQLLTVGFIASGIQAMIAFFREVLREDKRVKKGIERAMNKGYVAILADGELQWYAGLVMTLKDKSFCWRTKLFAICDNLVLI